MRKVLIHLFSGTGNTAGAVGLMKKQLEERGFTVDVLTVGNKDQEIKPGYDWHIFAFSVLAWGAPTFYREYLSRLPYLNGQKAAVFCTHSGEPGQALLRVKKILKYRHFKVMVTSSAHFPNNWTQASNPDTPKDYEISIKEAETILDRFVNFIDKEETHIEPCKPFVLALTGLLNFLFSRVGRRVMGKFYIADHKCTNCGICVNSCPVETIKIKGMIKRKPFWGFNCENCDRCINICPEKAIQVSIPRIIIHLGLNILVIVFAIRMLMHTIKYFAGTEPFLMATIILESLVLIVALTFWFQFWLIDRVVFFLEQIPFFSQKMEWSYTKNFRRYVAPGFKPLKTNKKSS